jgi:large subunit ribosomal protein L24
MSVKLKIKKGDNVKVIAGDDKGKHGKVLEVFPDKNRAIVEGVNMVTKHTKPNSKFPQGGRIPREASINISNLMVICPETGEPTRVGRMLSEKPSKDGKTRLVRYSKKSKQAGNIKILD